MAKKAKPGSKGGGEYYRIEVRPKSEFTSFRYHDVGDPGKIQRLAGQREDGSWADHAWLIEKSMAKIEEDRLVAIDDEAKEVLDEIKPITRIKGDIFKGRVND